MVRQVDIYKDDIDKLVESRNALRKEGGKVKFCVYTASGHDNITSELTSDSTEKVFEILINEYKDKIKEIKSITLEVFDSIINVN